jgi:alkylation response protein AidB-like acyl-CoA dehydrogenase
VSAVSDTLERVHALLPTIEKRADEIEQERHLPLDLVNELVAAGCFRMLVPRSHGGDELPLVEIMRVFEALAHADAATSWTAFIGSTSPVFFGFFPRSTFDEIYATGPDVIGGGTIAPKGTATRVDGGWVYSGQWPFGSGCLHSSKIVLHAMVIEDGQPQFMANGMPRMRLGLFDHDQVEILDTWYVSGLRGTGSNDLRVDSVFVPDAHTCTVFGGTPRVDAAVFTMPVMGQLAILMGSVAVGIAAGAVHDVSEIARAKRPVFQAKRLAESAVFQDRLGEADGLVRAARALLHDEAEFAWERAMARREPTLLDRARMRACGGQAAVLAARAVDIAYNLGGGSSLYDTCPLQRRLRDIHALTQHVAMSREHGSMVGALLGGEEIDPLRI